MAGLMARMKELSARIKEEDAALTALEEKQKELLLCLPNLPDPDLKAAARRTTSPSGCSASSPNLISP